MIFIEFPVVKWGCLLISMSVRPTDYSSCWMCWAFQFCVLIMFLHYIGHICWLVAMRCVLTIILFQNVFLHSNWIWWIIWHLIAYVNSFYVMFYWFSLQSNKCVYLLLFRWIIILIVRYVTWQKKLFWLDKWLLSFRRSASCSR